MAFLVQAVRQVFTAGGGANGNIQVASTTGFVAGAYAWIKDTAAGDPDATARRVRITKIVDGTNLTVRFDETINTQGFINGEGYPSNMANSDLTAYPITTSSISMPEQVVNGQRNDLDPLDRA